MDLKVSSWNSTTPSLTSLSFDDCNEKIPEDKDIPKVALMTYPEIKPCVFCIQEIPQSKKMDKIGLMCFRPITLQQSKDTSMYLCFKKKTWFWGEGTISDFNVLALLT